MPYYETVFIARQELSHSQVKELTDKYTKVLKDNGGKIHKTEDWGLRTLAYRISKNRKGFYVLVESEAPGAAIIEMERQMRIDDHVLRFLTIREEKLSEGPSPVLNKDSGDDYDKHEKHDKKEAA